MDKDLAREAKKYDNPIPSREYILKTLKKHKHLKKSELSQLLTLEDDQQKAFAYRIKAMLRDKQLSVNEHGELILFHKKNALVGKVIGNPRGFGFVDLVGQTADLRLSAKQMQTVFHGETVLVRRFYDKKEAQILGFENRIETIVGRTIAIKGIYYLQADDKRIIQKILIKTHAKKPPMIDQMVVGKITRYPSNHELTIVQITQVLGSYFDAGVEVKSALLRYDIADEFSKPVLKEAGALPTQVLVKDKHNRIDLTHLPLITIDGEDSKDFDDAVCVQKADNGWRLWVCIADVSHYVKQNSHLDKQAKQRATSVYFPNQVVPMLPESISNGLCSLNPEVMRLCLCCELLISHQGEVENSKFYPAVMRSVARMTYTKVSQILVDKDTGLINKHKNIHPMLLELQALYQQLSIERKKRGAMIIDRSESQILFADNGRIERIISKKSNQAHRIIEECMLLANCACAQFLTENKASFLYRVHAKPKLEKLEKLREFLTALGLDFPQGHQVVTSDFMQLAQTTSNRHDAHLIQSMILRSMQQATYTPNNIGHFGLAFESYTHFTSPIRRYPDLIAHRAIKQILDKQSKQVDKMAELGKHCSEQERNAELASRDVEQWLKCEFMSHRLGQTYQGVISGVGNFGLFVELADLLIDGLVSINRLDDDYYMFDQEIQSLIGRSSQKHYALGDSLSVKVQNVSVHERKIELSLC